jgi:hypothetical protein
LYRVERLRHPHEDAVVKVRRARVGIDSLRRDVVGNGLIRSVNAGRLRVRLDFDEVLDAVGADDAAERIKPARKRSVRVHAAAVLVEKDARPIFSRQKGRAVARRVGSQEVGGAHRAIVGEPCDFVRTEWDHLVETAATASAAFVRKRRRAIVDDRQGDLRG